MPICDSCSWKGQNVKEKKKKTYWKHTCGFLKKSKTKIEHIHAPKRKVPADSPSFQQDFLGWICLWWLCSSDYWGQLPPTLWISLGSNAINPSLPHYEESRGFLHILGLYLESWWDVIHERNPWGLWIMLSSWWFQNVWLRPEEEQTLA